MQLSLEQVRAVTNGAEHVAYEDGFFRFFRFTPQQIQLYRENSDEDYAKCFHTSGVKLRFRTNSRTLFLEVDTDHVVSRHYFAFSVLVNGEMVGALKNFDDAELTGHYSQNVIAHQPLSDTFALGEGEKEVCIYLPWSCAGKIKSVVLDEGSRIEPVIWQKKLIAFGDSITHGYDARYPHNKYISKLAEALNAQEFNKAIGGDVFFPALADTDEIFAPDYICVAYGTNDWRKTTLETMQTNCRAFYKNLHTRYPDAKIFAITPIWREDSNQSYDAGAFSELETLFRRATEDLDNVTVITGIDLVPEDTSLFADLRLHPSDQGFDHYFRNLYSKLQEFLPVAD